MRNERTVMLIGEENMQTIKNANVIVFGLGGVGGYVVESLARVGVGNLTIVDFDTISESNLNRQIVATYKNIGNSKAKEMQSRILDVNKDINVAVIDKMITKDNIGEVDFSKFDYVVDAIDMVTTKLAIIEQAKLNNVKAISCMGTGNKFDPGKLKVSDISKTNYCPLAKVMRKELSKRNIKDVKVVWSDESPKKDGAERKAPSSYIFVPATAGLLIGYEVIKDIINNK